MPRATRTPTEPAFQPPVFTRDDSLPIPDLIDTEWVLTNGLGGFAMGTALGVPTRRYHGLLVAATTPPVGRVVALAHAAERVVLDPGGPAERAVELSTFEFNPASPMLHPDGHRAFRSFRKALDVRFEHAADEVRVAKVVHLHRDANAVTVRYDITVDNAAGARLEVRPLLAMRDFHHLRRRADFDRFSVRPAPRGATVSLDGRELVLESHELRAQATGSEDPESQDTRRSRSGLVRAARFAHEPHWWYDFFYRADAARGQECSEDLFCPGVFTLDLGPGTTSTAFTARLGPAPARTPDEDRAARTARLHSHFAAASAPPASAPSRTSRAAPPSPDLARALAALVTAADDFVVARAIPGRDDPAAPTGTTVIAGYPWFSDWGRDTLICLRGLLLTTGRSDQARATLVNFARHRRHGIIPNVFSEADQGAAEYNTVDASLWFLQAACDYLAATGDRAAWRDELLPACLDIVEHYRRGTDFNIAEDPIDRLIAAGTEGTQLTWMDAKRDGVVFTPRHGKCVEINALWHSGLRRLAAATATDDPRAGADLTDLAEAVARSFRASFWNDRRRCLYDRLVPAPHGWAPSEELRPNQIFAVSLPHSPLPPDQQLAVLAAVRDRLATPFGLRTLDPADGRYRGRYQGTLFERDGAYHNGTAWPFLLGPFAEATLRAGAFSESAKHEAREILAPLIAELDRRAGGSPGQIAEVYDGDGTPAQPPRPSGCPAQAWSVAEPLRVLAMTL